MLSVLLVPRSVTSIAIDLKWRSRACFNPTPAWSLPMLIRMPFTAKGFCVWRCIKGRSDAALHRGSLIDRSSCGQMRATFPASTIHPQPLILFSVPTNGLADPGRTRIERSGQWSWSPFNQRSMYLSGSHDRSYLEPRRCCHWDHNPSTAPGSVDRGWTIFENRKSQLVHEPIIHRSNSTYYIIILL